MDQLGELADQEYKSRGQRLVEASASAPITYPRDLSSTPCAN